MGRGSDLAFVGKVSDVGLNFLRAHILWMALLVEKDEACDPLDVGLFSAIGIIPQGDATRCLTRMVSRTWSSSFFGLSSMFTSRAGFYAIILSSYSNPKPYKIPSVWGIIRFVHKALYDPLKRELARSFDIKVI